MIIYEVWDHDPMDGSMGKDYIAKRYTDRATAAADVEARNAAWRRDFEAHAWDGQNRAEREPWNWRYARVVEAKVDE